MTFVSYAQNFEDVLLWRALRDVPHGFYVDVGAAHPDIDSVTRAFYDRGWSGINIEPTPEYSLRLAAARPRDVNLRLVLGERAGRTRMFVVDGTGLSTTEPSSVAPLRAAGMDVQSADVAVDTLANVCRAHAADTIHFLKIDVEGAEKAVLSGADFTVFRPWIVVIEATAPMTTAETHGEWEFILLDADYRFVWFDGLNRFYIAAEMYERLNHAFGTPPNVFDDFIRAADSEWARRIHEAETRASLFRERLLPAELRVTQLLERAVAAEGRADFESLAAAHARLRCDDATRDVAQLREALKREAAGREAAEANSALQANRAAQEAARSAVSDRQTLEAVAAFEAIRNSTSWRITAPMRRLRSRANSGGPVLKQEPVPIEVPRPPCASAISAPVGRALIAPSAHSAYRTAVHQFHSGAATGDAITNSMLLTRARLRALGYQSDIFVTYRDEALAHELRLTEELPQHEHYVLILRHSLGFDRFENVVALPAPKVLLYHNITPSDLLQGDEFLQRYSILGRQQLEALRGVVCASLADSEYNAVELRALGFSPVQVCQLLFDVDSLLARAASTAAVNDNDFFTVLFVGRVVRSKGQADLLDAFAAFRNRYGKPCRLVLVGRHGGSGDAYAQAIEARLKAYALSDDVTLTGAVSDDELHSWYKRADLYLSLSQHEGFGVPLVEAMAHHLPVLALATGAVPYTLGFGSGLLLDNTTGAVVDRLLELAQDKERRVALARSQYSGLQRFRWKDNEPPLLQALAIAGAAPPRKEETRAALGAGMRITIAGHVNGSYSLAGINRSISSALEAERPGMNRLVAVEGEPTEDLSGVPEAEVAAISELAARPVPLTGPHVVISQHYPVYVFRDPCDLALAYFFWEESVVPPETIACLNEGFGGVLAPSNFVAKALVDSGLSVPVRVVGFSPDLGAFRDLAEKRATGKTDTFTFLHISSGFPRKGVDILLEAFRRTFRRTDPVRLIIKVFPNPHNDVEDRIRALQAEDGDAPRIVLIDRDIDEHEMLDLYRDSDVMVLPTRGEGFNLPAAEAMAAGLHLIVTGFGGHTDFCCGSVRYVNYRFASSGSHLAVPGSLWVEPDVEDLSRALWSALRQRGTAVPLATLPSRREFAHAVVEAATDLLTLPRLQRPLRIGWVSSWGVRCGIAEYSRHIIAALGASIGQAEITIFCDDRTPTGATAESGVTVVPCWPLGLVDGARPLLYAAAISDPDVLVIQHQPGLISWPSLREMISAAAMAARLVVLVLHTTQRILDIEEEEQKHLIEAFKRVTRVVVHTVDDLNRLKVLGLVDNTTMMPQGIIDVNYAPASVRRDHRSLLVGCYGFFLPDKGIPQLIKAVASLRPHKDIRLRLVNAEYGSPESRSEIARCRALAEQVGLKDYVEWRTEFAEDRDSLRQLAECDLVVLPYQHSKEGSSAALRMAVASGAPVAVTPLRLFDEAERAVYRFNGTESADILTGLQYVLDRPQVLQALREEAEKWQQPRRWPCIGARFGGMLRGLYSAGRSM
ncbi:MAG: FkbM family methyltransferase [Proteobacteria bacterium]|nr:FkbM family methyltransferase [Pseudomonadota bacterium]